MIQVAPMEIATGSTLTDHAGEHEHGERHATMREDTTRHRPPAGARPGARDAGRAEVMSRSNRNWTSAERHPEAGSAKPAAPAVGGRDDRHEPRAEQRAEVDAHVEDREAGVARAPPSGVELRRRPRSRSASAARRRAHDHQAQRRTRSAERTVSIKLPSTMMQPAPNTARCCPISRSAIQPPNSESR